MMRSLVSLLQEMQPRTWGAPAWHQPRFTRQYRNGVLQEDVEPDQGEVEAVIPAADPMELLEQLVKRTRGMPRVFLETDVPEGLRSALDKLVELGVLTCVHKRRADCRQYMQRGVGR